MNQIEEYVEVKQYVKLLEEAYAMALDMLPNLIKAGLIFFIGLWAVRFINRIESTSSITAKLSSR